MLFVMVMLVVVMAAAALMLFVVVMLMVVAVCLGQFCQFLCQGSLAFHGLQQLRSGKLAPGGGDDGSFPIVLPDQGHGSIQLGLGHRVGTGQDDGGSGFDLVIVELTKVLHIDLDLTGIADSHGIAQSHIFVGDLLHSADNIGEFANTGGFDDDPVGIILCDDLLQGLAEVTHQRAADAAGVHLGDIDAGILQEAAVDADLAELIFNEHQLLACIGLLDHLFDEGSLAGSQKAGVNIDFCHR